MAAISTARYTGGRKNRITKKSGASTTDTTIRVTKSYTSKSAAAALIGRDGPVELLLGEVGPQHVCEIKFRIGGLPRQEIGQPQLSAGPDDEIRVRHPPGKQIAGELGLT